MRPAMRWAVLAALVLAGCVAAPAPPAGRDAPAAQPAWEGFHRAGDIEGFQAALATRAGGIAQPFVLGSSVQGREILGVRLTAPGDPADRARVLVDGGIHGNEVYGAEAAMYLASWLVENAASNATATRVLDNIDLRIVFLLNPDGRAADARENAHRVDLNRNFDVDFGNPNPLCRSQSVDPAVPYYYAGPEPLSEPETSALAALMAEFEPQIYLSHHTGRDRALIRPWSACEPPHPMPASDNALFESIEAWARGHTTYQNTGTAEETAQRLFPPGAASGSSADWCYLTYHCVALTLEVTGAYGEGDEDPVAVAEEAMAISLHVLAHAEAYGAWRDPGDGS
jgi:hypothetical protein